mmetsp:Transcript_30641/g.56664  ORF Transcript_30641/g.56664 Transcript_30641/m.56664 type:complete len:87 (+) Transcript_30641:539-799(+)
MDTLWKLLATISISDRITSSQGFCSFGVEAVSLSSLPPNQKKKSKLLGLISGTGYVGPPPSSSSVVSSTSGEKHSVPCHLNQFDCH